MKLSEFKFKMPDSQVPLYPLYNRDECRLMVLHRKSETIEMYKKDEEGKEIEGEFLKFRDLLDYFEPGDTMIFNDTKVFPARLYGTKEKTDAKIEVFLLRELNEEMRLWDVLVEPARKIRIGNKLFFDETGTMVAEVIDNTTSRGRTLRFLYDCPHDEFIKELYALGEAPLPHYIIDQKLNFWVKKEDYEDIITYRDVTPDDGKPKLSEEDNEDEWVHITGPRNATKYDIDSFQTVYATNEGAVTAPFTGLHFTDIMMKLLELKDINKAFITMHCSLGTFNTIDVEDLTKHKMESEQIIIPAEACRIVNETKEKGHRVCCVGVSTLRATESAVGTDGMLKEFSGWTNRFIYPPYDFGLGNCLLTNLYTPESTLMIAGSAFGGYELVDKAYKLASSKGYKFGCYGDAMLILDD